MRTTCPKFSTFVILLAGYRWLKIAPGPLISNANHFLTTQCTPQERDQGQNTLARPCGVLLFHKSDWHRKFTKFIRMKIIEIVKINKELLKNLHTAGVRIEDAEYIDLFADYRKLLDEGEKVSYIVALLSDRYGVSERKVYTIIKHFKSDCKLFAV